MNGESSSIKEVDSEECFVDVPGGQVFVKKWNYVGAKDLSIPPVFLLHDSLGCTAMWRLFPALLSKNLRATVIAYDRLGYGRSTERTALPTQEFIREEATFYFPAIRGQLGISEFAVMGHSVGGSMALLSAVNFPQNKWIVSESTQAMVENLTLESIRRSREAFKHPDQFNRLKKYHGSRTEWVLRAWTDTWLDPQFFSWTLKDDLPKICVPVLAIHGDRDEYSSSNSPEMIANLVGGPSEMIIMRDCGHVPHREKERDVLRVIGEFAQKGKERL